jgi:hypothetical protein
MHTFGGLSGVAMAINEVDLGNGVIVRRTYAHLFAPFMMAFRPPGKHKHHDGPWKAAKGGVSFDILAEIEVAQESGAEWALGPQELIWLIASLLRLSAFPYLTVAALSDISFNDVLSNSKDPTLQPLETRHRIFSPPEGRPPVLQGSDLDWVKGVWMSTAELMKTDARFQSALKAFDSATVEGRVSSSLMILWGAIEHLFSPNVGELRYRVSANMATFLADRGPERLKLFKELSALYAHRSTAAHTTKELENSPLVASYVHLRNALVKIVDQGRVPTQNELEELLFM